MKLILMATVIGVGVLISRFVKYIGPFISVFWTIGLLMNVVDPKAIEQPTRMIVGIIIIVGLAVVASLTVVLGELLIQLNERIAIKMQSSIEIAEQQTSSEQR